MYNRFIVRYADVQYIVQLALVLNALLFCPPASTQSSVCWRRGGRWSSILGYTWSRDDEFSRCSGLPEVKKSHKSPSCTHTLSVQSCHGDKLLLLEDATVEPMIISQSVVYQLAIFFYKCLHEQPLSKPHSNRLFLIDTIKAKNNIGLCP